MKSFYGFAFLCLYFRSYISLEMAKVEGRIQSSLLTIEHVSPSQILLRLRPNYQESYEKIVNFTDIPADIKCIFSDMSQFYEGMRNLIHEGNEKKIIIGADGSIEFIIDIIVFGRSIQKKLKFSLQKILDSKQEIQVLKNQLISVRKEVDDLKSTVKLLTIDNNTLKIQFESMEKALIDIVNRKVSYELDSTKNIQTHETETVQPQSSQIAKEKQEIVKQESSIHSSVTLPLQFDTQCLHYDKFIIENNTITSKFEDYYQINFKNPLPNEGIFMLTIRGLSQNHYSIGVMSEAALKNQYSFQNNKVVCLYSYYFGNFRGVYNRSKYQSLKWPVEANQYIEVLIDMNRKRITFEIDKHSLQNTTNIKQLAEEGPLYFFVEMYEKNNKIQFLE